MTASPPICGREAELRALMQQQRSVWSGRSGRQLNRIRAGFACALHMHQPTVPAGINGALISHLQFMVEHPNDGDNHNAEPFAQCYRRMADLIPDLIAEGCSPRIMLRIWTRCARRAWRGLDELVRAPFRARVTFPPRQLAYRFGIISILSRSSRATGT